MKNALNRRRFLWIAAATTLSGCSRLATALNDNQTFHNALLAPERLNLALLGAGQPLAQEYPASAISPDFRANGFDPPSSPEYAAWAARGWQGFKLTVGGLVERPSWYDLAALRRRFVKRTQITRHDCVEGWSVIGKWGGVRLADLLADTGVRPGAAFVVFRCMDTDPMGMPYYESLSLQQAAHPQALVAYELNDRPVPIKNGAPLRIKVPTQLGYKSAKYVHRIELVASLAGLAGGNGGYWEDQGYEWYAGI
jgi:DMSO/TMAO reductase YedYZ molybdopterin-dependent catalytic subunit